MIVVAACVVLMQLEPSRPPSVEACATAAEQAQELRQHERLLEASKKLAICVSASCPAIVRLDCERWMREVRERTPRIVFSVTDDRGRVEAADLTLDGASWRPLMGEPVALDPGHHTVEARAGARFARARFELAPTAEVRQVQVTLGPAAAPRPDQRASSLWQPRVYVPGAVTVASAAAFGVFQLLGQTRYDDLREGCGRTSSCAPADVAALESTFDRAAVALVITGVALGVTIWQIIAVRGSAAPQDAGPRANVFGP